MTLTAAGQKTRRFSVAERRQRLADLPPKFLAHDAHAAEAPQARFGEQLNHEVDVWQEEAMTPAELGPAKHSSYRPPSRR